MMIRARNTFQSQFRRQNRILTSIPFYSHKNGFNPTNNCNSFYNKGNNLKIIFHNYHDTSRNKKCLSSSTLKLSNNLGIESQPYEETIYALSSSPSYSSTTNTIIGSSATAVGVIRITGPQSHLALRILLSKYSDPDDLYNSKITLPKPRFASLRTLYDPFSTLDTSTISTSNNGNNSKSINSSHNPRKKENDPLDSSLILLFQSPSSFTGQDLIEIHCHGSRGVISGILQTLSNLSKEPFNLWIRPATKGEFTSRAYENGKLGLVEVEALADLIVADTSFQRLQALRQLDGRTTFLYDNWRSDLIKGLAHAEAVIDFGDDEDLDASDSMDGNSGDMNVWGGIKPRIQDLRRRMEKHLQDSQRGEIMRDGVKVAIVGPPNAGKSSLLNLLANREAAIVSPIAGTTRDVIEVTMDLGGVRCIISDTAGVREGADTGDIIEWEGIKRAKKVASEAHVLVCMADSTDVDKGVAIFKDILGGFENKLEPQNVFFLRNKVDLGGNVSASTSPLPNVKEYGISCETSQGVDNFINDLTESVVRRVVGNDSDENDESENPIGLEDDGVVITRARHRRHIEAASAALQRFEVMSEQGYMAVDMAAEELRLAASELGRITGAVDVEDVLDVLFADFCIGK